MFFSKVALDGSWQNICWRESNQLVYLDLVVAQLYTTPGITQPTIPSKTGILTVWFDWCLSGPHRSTQWGASTQVTGPPEAESFRTRAQYKWWDSGTGTDRLDPAQVVKCRYKSRILCKTPHSSPQPATPSKINQRCGLSDWQKCSSWLWWARGYSLSDSTEELLSIMATNCHATMPSEELRCQ